MEMKFALGDKVKDKITGYKGTITSVCFSINRPVSYLVEGIDTTDRPISDWIDDVISDDNRDDIPIQVCPKCKTFFPLSQTGGGHHFCPACGQKFKVKEVSDG